jgi:hypothetical protein
MALASALRTLTDATCGRTAENVKRSVLEEAATKEDVVGGLEMTWSCSCESRWEIIAKVPLVKIVSWPAEISMRCARGVTPVAAAKLAFATKTAWRDDNSTT